MKITSEKASTIYSILNDAKITKLEDDEKFALIRIMRTLKPIAQEYELLVQEAVKKLRPDNIEVLEGKIQRREKLSPDEWTIYEKFNKDVMDCLAKERLVEIDAPYEGLSEDAMKRLISSNDFPVSRIMFLYDTIGKRNGE